VDRHRGRHANGGITTHYSAAELDELLAAAEKIVDRGIAQSPTLTVVRRTFDKAVGNENGITRNADNSLILRSARRYSNSRPPNLQAQSLNFITNLFSYLRRLPSPYRIPIISNLRSMTK
jgi:hypothetical protein